MLSPRRREHGQDLIEYALVMPVLLGLLFGILEFALILYTYNTLDEAAREGTRYGLVATNNISDIQSQAVDKVTRAAGPKSCIPGPLPTVRAYQSGNKVVVEVTCKMNVIAWLFRSPTITLKAVSTKEIDVEQQ